jgi:AcrR family transcriptional regulator
VDTVPTLRDRKKAATSEALARAAMQLAQENGLENVTVEAIAEAANVSRRTFSNYFAHKEDALLYGYRASVERVLDGLRARPAHEGAWQAVRRSAADMYEEIATADPESVARLRMIRKHPSLLAAQLAMHAELEADLATELATRTADPLAARVMAAAFLGSLHIAVAIWLENPEAGSLADALDRVLDQFGHAFSA